MRVDITVIKNVESPETIKMIKLVRSETGMELKPAKELIMDEVVKGGMKGTFTVSVGNMDEIRTIRTGIESYGFLIINYEDIEKIFGDIETEFKQFIQRCVQLEKMALASDLCGVFAKHYYGG